MAARGGAPRFGRRQSQVYDASELPHGAASGRPRCTSPSNCTPVEGLWKRGRRTPRTPAPTRSGLEPSSICVRSSRREPSTCGSPRAASTSFPTRYTFDNFVLGASNRFAHAAAMAVAEAPPSKAYNPLFIYGGVGLGKTHLLYAIANHMTMLTPALRTKYVTSEAFVMWFAIAYREGQGYLFQRR